MVHFSRNVGLPYGVDQEYFEWIQGMKNKLENEHIDPYVSILATNPKLAGIKSVKPKKRIMGPMFMVTVTVFVRNLVFSIILVIFLVAHNSTYVSVCCGRCI